MITVLLCVYNGEKWLRECIESVLNQTYKNFEFLIINDGSFDNSLKIIKEFALLDKRIKYITHENIGLTKSLNIGLNASRGDWIARIDCDDIALPKRLELQLSYILKENISAVGCQSILINNDESKKKKYFVPTKSDKIYSNLIMQKSFFSHSSVLFNKEVVLSIGGYREFFNNSQDYDLWLRLSEIGKLGCLKYFGIYIRDHKNRISIKDKGIEQRTYAHCANISHIIRIKYGNKYDPLNQISNNESTYFFDFVYKNLKKTNTLFFYKKLYDFKDKLKGSNLIVKLIFIPRYFNNFDLILKLIIWISFGDFISKKIAKKWLKYN